MNNFYTYIYLDPRIAGAWSTETATFLYEPFYVGKGSKKRYLQHKQSWSYSKKHSHKNHRIKNIIDDNYEPIVIVLEKDITQYKALEFESSLIKQLGTRSLIPNIKYGPLTNLKIDGVIQKYSEDSRTKMSISASRRIRDNHSEETKVKMRASSKSGTPEVRAKLSAARKGKPQPEGHRERMSKLHKGKKLSQKQIEFLKTFRLGIPHTEESKRKMTESQLCSWKIIKEDSEEIITTNDLHKWCHEMSFNYGTFYGTLPRKKYHKGYQLVEKLFSPRNQY